MKKFAAFLLLAALGLGILFQRFHREHMDV